MKAVVYSRTGGPEVLQLVDREVPSVEAGEVRVRIAVSGVNPTDWKSRAGSGDGRELDVEQVPNQDGAGIVDEIGLGVTRFAVGDRVWVRDTAFQRPTGTAAEYTVLPDHLVNPLPDGVSFDVGASLGIPALTAHRALTARDAGPARLSPGSLAGTTVLVTGGAGAVGHAAIQLAAWAGATVITTVSSPAKAALAAAAGAHHVIDYRSEDVVARVNDIAPGGVETVVDVNPLENIDDDVAVVARGGTIAIYVSGEPDGIPVPARASMTKNIRFQFVLTYTTSEAEKSNAIAAVSAAAAAGALEVGEGHGLPLVRFALTDTAAAHRAVEDGAVGKVRIDVAAL
ncbi:NADPH:quinone reductase [Subtercola boreus]|uniref:NADPH:quinone reductase n=1 Tax=Subtercola boreus TaxID=120213 RepID=A0A3E0W7D7_9MICO|nr:NADPH:quinone reductase [Subtercola boreus]RFA19005.1 NADPH:quinone reductase [Subtercola boreus]RFA19143.1 NADPH:quinone reductase [Subtercola boreus]RFA25605.1 NADPH:quinone reductase [Subtercola boreus]